MPKPKFKKADAKAAAEMIAARLGAFFNVPVPEVACEGMGNDWECRLPAFDHALEVWTKAGRAECNISIDSGFAHLYFRFDDPARAKVYQDGAGRLNEFSGKWNRIGTPGDYARAKKDGTPNACPATSLEVFCAHVINDFRRVAEPNPPSEEVAAYRAKEDERRKAFAEWLDEVKATA